MVHCYKLNGYNIVLDVFSGSVHVVDEVAFDAISMYESTPKDEIKKTLLERYSHLEDVSEAEIDELFEDIEELKEDGKLFAPDVYEHRAFDL